jgi:hypothetical protein
LTHEEAATLDRRWMNHVQRPESSIPWDEVRRKLLDPELSAVDVQDDDGLDFHDSAAPCC